MTLKQLQNKLSAIIKDSITTDLMREIVNTSAENVKTRTRRGFGVKKEGDRAEKLKGISESYKKQRRRLKKQGKLSSDTSPAKSNLTRSGEMVNNVKGKVESSTKGTILIDGDKNRNKAKYQAEEGRTFMNLSKAEIKDIEKVIEQHIKNDITKKGL